MMLRVIDVLFPSSTQAERVHGHSSPSAYNENRAESKKALSSPPTSLSEVNFALRSSARQSQASRLTLS